MPNYNVMITEVRSKIVKIQGDDPKSAERETRKKWESAEPGYRLSEKDLAAVYFTALGTDRLFRPDPTDPLDL